VRYRRAQLFARFDVLAFNERVRLGKRLSLTRTNNDTLNKRSKPEHFFHDINVDRLLPGDDPDNTPRCSAAAVRRGAARPRNEHALPANRDDRRRDRVRRLLRRVIHARVSMIDVID
jgi:hypothetical protein